MRKERNRRTALFLPAPETRPVLHTALPRRPAQLAPKHGVAFVAAGPCSWTKCKNEGVVPGRDDGDNVDNVAGANVSGWARGRTRLPPPAKPGL